MAIKISWRAGARAKEGESDSTTTTTTTIRTVAMSKGECQAKFPDSFRNGNLPPRSRIESGAKRITAGIPDNCSPWIRPESFLKYLHFTDRNAFPLRYRATPGPLSGKAPGALSGSYVAPAPHCWNWLISKQGRCLPSGEVRRVN